MNTYRQYSFWGSLSPLGGLTGAGLLIIASARLSWAITVAGSLIWVYGLTAFSYVFLVSVIPEKFFPSSQKTIIYICLASIFASIYIFIFWLLCPFAALEVFMLLFLVPLFSAANAEYFIKDTAQDIDFDHVSNSVSSGLVLVGLLILFSIIREPLSYNCLTFPGSSLGMITIMYFNENAVFPIEIFSSAAGGFLLLGYILCLYQYSKSYIMPGER